MRLAEGSVNNGVLIRIDRILHRVESKLVEHAS